MSEVKNVPELRFPEFSGDWRNLKLAKISSWSSGGTPSKSEAEYWDGSIPWISASSMKSKFLSDSELKITEQGLINGSKQAPKNSLLLLVRGSMLYNKIPIGITSKNVAFNQDVKCLQINKSSSTEFVYNWFKHSENRLLNMVVRTGIGAGKLETSDLQSMKVGLPCVEEQQKIAGFLSSVDQKIEQLTEKHRQLTDYKKGVMQQIFTQQIRFKDPQGNDYPEWDNCKLKQMASFFSGGTPTSTNKAYYVGNIPFIKSGEIGVIKTEQFISETALKSSSAKMVLAGDLLYALYGATSGEVAISKIEGAINQAVLCIRSEQNKVYLYSWLKFRKSSILSAYLQGGQGNLSAQIIRELKIPFPCCEEQQKIADFLTAIDQKIDHAQSQLNQTKAFKKGLLQKMFV